MASGEEKRDDRLPPPEQSGDEISIGDVGPGSVVAAGRGATATIVYQSLSIEEVAALVVELKRIDQPVVWDGRLPYLGLRSFQERDYEFFFGREKLVDELLERVARARFITITGPSGSGKSSLARAGLFHALRTGRLDGSDGWLLAALSPGNDPLEQLALAMARLAGSPNAAVHIREHGKDNPLALHEQVESLLSDDPRQRCILLVDQFEELFTQTQDDAVRAAFIDLLTTAAAQENGRVTVVIALRSDFISKCARHPALLDAMGDEFHLVGAMQPAELTRAITLPSLEVGAEIDPALVKKIMDDMKGEPGALPLMSFALRDLFEVEKTTKGAPMDLTLQEYLDLGGIESALEQHAARVFATFTPEQQALARNVFSRLITIGEGSVDTRRTAVFSELVPEGAYEEDIAAVVRGLSGEGARLVTTGGLQSGEELTAANLSAAQATVTLAHETLIDVWPWLRRLVEEDREIIALRNTISSDAQQWLQEKDDGYLYRGGRLLHVEEQLGSLNLDQDSGDFVKAGINRREEEARRRKWTWIAIGSLLLVLLVGSTIAAVLFNRQADENASIAAAAVAAEREARARWLVSNGQRWVEDEPLLGLALVLEGLDLGRQGGPALQNSVLDNSIEEVFKHGRVASFGNDFDYVQFSDDGRIAFLERGPSVATGEYPEYPKELRLLENGALVNNLSGKLQDVNFHPFVSRSVDFYPFEYYDFYKITYEDGSLELRHTADSNFIMPMVNEPESISRVAATPDGTESVLYIKYADKPAELRFMSDVSVIPDLAGDIADIAYNAQEPAPVFAVNYENAPPELRSAADGSVIFDPQPNERSISLSPDRDATLMAIEKKDGSVQIRRTDDRDLIAAFLDGMEQLAFSPAGSHFVADPIDGLPGLYQAHDGSLVEDLPQNLAEDGVLFSPDEAAAYFVAFYDDGSAELRSSADGRLLAPLEVDSEKDVEFSDDESASLLLVKRKDTPPLLLNTADGSLFSGLEQDIRDIAFLAHSPFFVVDYLDSDTSDELRYIADGRLAGKLWDINVAEMAIVPGRAGSLLATYHEFGEGNESYSLYYFPDEPDDLGLVEPDVRLKALNDLQFVDGLVFGPVQVTDALIVIDEGQVLLVRMSDGRELADLGRDVQRAAFTADGRHLVVHYIDGRVYVLDVAWLQAMDGNPYTPFPDDLVKMACQYPLADGLPDESQLANYFPDREPPLFRACEGVVDSPE